VLTDGWMDGRTFNIKVPTAKVVLNITDSKNIIPTWWLQSTFQQYSQTCIKRSPMGHRKSGLIRQVTS